MTVRRMPWMLIVLVLVSAALPACQPGAAADPGADQIEEPTSEEPQPSDPPPPTEEPTPTDTPTPEPTEIGPLPAGSPNGDWEPIVREFNGLPMVYVPAGCFLMGSTDEQVGAAFAAGTDLYSGAPFPCEKARYEAEAPQHEVCLDAFWIGQTEVTNAQYAACVEAGACSPPADRAAYDDPGHADHPVLQVTWGDALAYAAWLGLSLPTEAQWEYAARGPEGWGYPWGDVFAPARLNYCDVNCDIYFWADLEHDDGYALTSPVGAFPNGASWVGALDMSGNAWEWTSSLYLPYPYDPTDGREDPAASGERVQRGGAFDLSHVDLRTAVRYPIPPDNLCRGYGFRVAAPASLIAVEE